MGDLRLKPTPPAPPPPQSVVLIRPSSAARVLAAAAAEIRRYELQDRPGPAAAVEGLLQPFRAPGSRTPCFQVLREKRWETHFTLSKESDTVLSYAMQRKGERGGAWKWALREGWVTVGGWVGGAHVDDPAVLIMPVRGRERAECVSAGACVLGRVHRAPRATSRPAPSSRCAGAAQAARAGAGC